MDKHEKKLAGRRGFMVSLAGLLSGFFLASPKRVKARKPEIKDFLRNLEMEVMEKSRPRRQPSIVWSSDCEAKTVLSRKGEVRSICALNRAGKTIWEGCNGKNTPKDIAGLLQQHYDVTAEGAYLDCLTFLVDLKKKGAIEV